MTTTGVNPADRAGERLHHASAAPARHDLGAMGANSDRRALSDPLGPSTDHQPLNAADRLMLVGHDGMRSIDHAGFQCQSHLWLSGRVDVPTLRRALEALHCHYPVMTARLDKFPPAAPSPRRKPQPAGPRWAFQNNTPVELHEATLDASDEAAVWRYGGRWFDEPLDLPRMNPIGFHLLHLPDGRDVFLLRWSHVLMDGKAPELVVHEISQRFADPSLPASPPPAGDEMQAHLAKFDRKLRRQAAARVIRSHIRLPVRPLTLVPPDAPDWVTGPFRMIVRTLDADATERCAARVKRLCGFNNMAPVVLASVFRACLQHTPRRVKGRSLLQTDVPLNLRPPGSTQPLFRNFMAFISLGARVRDLARRDDLAQQLNVQMREQLRRGIDLGNLQMMAFMSRYDRMLAKHIKSHMQKSPMALGFGFLGPAFGGMESFCDVPVERFYTLNSALAPPGITLQVNVHRGRLNFALTYVGDAVPDSLAQAFLDTMVADLLDERASR